MKSLPENVSFDRVIPLLAASFGTLDALERATLASFSEELVETPHWQLLEEAVESGYLLPEEIHKEFGAFLRDELSDDSWEELRCVDREFLQAAALGEASSLFILGLRLIRAATGAVDSSESVELEQDGLFLIVEAAEAGEQRAQWMLGERFSRMQDGLEESVRLLGMAAKQQYQPAKIRLEELFLRRYTFVHQPSERKWLKRFARAGVVSAQVDLANDLHLQGEAKAGFAWMLEAAKAGHRLAQQRLAFFYDVGDGCTRDPQRAAYWKNCVDGMAKTELPKPPEPPSEENAPPRDDDLEKTFTPEIPDEDLSGMEGNENLGSQEDGRSDDDDKNDGCEDEVEWEIKTADRGLTAAVWFSAGHVTTDAGEIPLPDNFDAEETQFSSMTQSNQNAARDSGGSASPSTSVKKRPGIVSRFRSGLAGVLRRLANRISGSHFSNDDQ